MAACHSWRRSWYYGIVLRMMSDWEGTNVCMYEWTVNNRWAITFIYLWNSDQEEGRGRVGAFWEPTAPIEGISCLRYLPVMHSPRDCGRRRRVTHRALPCLAENLLHYYDIGSTTMHYASHSCVSSFLYLEEDGDEEVFLSVLHTAPIHTYIHTYIHAPVTSRIGHDLAIHTLSWAAGGWIPAAVRMQIVISMYVCMCVWIWYDSMGDSVYDSLASSSISSSYIGGQ